MNGACVELRDIEIFLTLAEELHFARTAERLHVTPARVSQAIKKQERQVGATLFERNNRAVALTPIGQRLRDDLRSGYDQIRTGLDRAAAAAAGIGGTLRLGVMHAIGYEVRFLLDAFRARPGCDVQVVESHFGDPFGPLRAGDVDVQLLWAPVREADLTVGPVLLTEGRLLGVATGHPLATRTSASMEDFGDYPAPDPGPLAPGYWFAARIPEYTPAGRRVPQGAVAHTINELQHLIATGQVISSLSVAGARYFSHPGIVRLPMPDAPPTEWILVWRTAAENELIRAFSKTCEDVLADIEIFLTLAEELHIGRTASRLHLTAAHVGRGVDNLGTALTTPDKNGIRLTPEGERLRNDLRTVYGTLLESRERIRQATRRPIRPR
jgi:DNA-binding transcriptional LysR family regulator